MLLLLGACVAGDGLPSVALRWVPSGEEEAWEDARRGVDWQLANLGALPPADDAHLVVEGEDADGVRFTLHLDRLALSPGATEALGEVAARLADDDEARAFGAVDVGRFFLLTLYEPAVYYRSTGACGTLAEWEARRGEGRELAFYGVTTSSVVAGERRLTFTPWAGDLTAVAVAAEEGEGSLVAGTFERGGVDVVDVLPNGQYRYAAYDAAGRLVGAADPARSIAGQPGRCMWCHEDHLDTYLLDNEPVAGGVDTAEFLAWTEAVEAGQADYQGGLATSLDTTDSEVHAHGERLTEGWLLPTPGRLGREWGLEEADVRALLAEEGVPLEANPEYPELGEVVPRERAEDVYRARIDADWSPVPTRRSARDPVATDLLPIRGLGGC